MTEPVRLGKRYECAKCQATLLCVRAGEGSGFTCCGEPMRSMELKKIPSSD